MTTITTSSHDYATLQALHHDLKATGATITDMNTQGPKHNPYSLTATFNDDDFIPAGQVARTLMLSLATAAEAATNNDARLTWCDELIEATNALALLAYTTALDVRINDDAEDWHHSILDTVTQVRYRDVDDVQVTHFDTPETWEPPTEKEMIGIDEVIVPEDNPLYPPRPGWDIIVTITPASTELRASDDS